MFRSDRIFRFFQSDRFTTFENRIGFNLLLGSDSNASDYVFQLRIGSDSDLEIKQTLRLRMVNPIQRIYI